MELIGTKIVVASVCVNVPRSSRLAIIRSLRTPTGGSVIAVAKLGIAIALFVYLLSSVRARDPNTFESLWNARLNWGMLVASALCYCATLVMMWVRWSVNLRALGLRYRGIQIARAGLIAYALDFAAIGPAGSDVTKGLLLSRGRSTERARVLASVAVDRVVGLLCLLTFVSFGIVVTGLDRVAPPLRVWVGAIPWLAAFGIMMLVACLFSDRLLAIFQRVVPAWIAQLIASLRGGLTAYRQSWRLLLAAVLLSFSMLAVQVLAFHLASVAMPGEGPTYTQHVAIVPLAMISSIVPLPGNALGVLDYAMTTLSEKIGGQTHFAANALLTLMAIRVLEVFVSSAGLLLYLVTSKRES